VTETPIQTSRISPLARRLVIFTVTFSTLVALISTAIQLYVDYRWEIGQVESTFEKIVDTHLPTISSALWSTNKKELKIALNGLSRLPDVRYVSVSEQDNVLVEVGKRKISDVKIRNYTLNYLHRNKMQTIGDLQVVIDLDAIYQRLLDKFWVILVTNSIKTFLVSGFMLWLFHFLVTRHLRFIAKFAARLGINNLEEKLRLPRKVSSKPDEFDLVLDGLSRMQSNLNVTLLSLESDIQKRKLVEEELNLLASVFKFSHQGIMITNVDGVIVDVNPSFTQITGYSSEEIIGQNHRVLQSNSQDSRLYKEMWHSLKSEGYWRGEIWNRRKNGEIYPEYEDISAVQDDTGSVINYVAIFSDISQQKQHEAELDHIAHYDLLTSLPNRRLLVELLEQALSRSEREGLMLAVAYLDLDEFKPINDRYGHAVGDRLLVEISHRLRSTLRGSDTLARLGGDEFVILLGELDHVNSCMTSLERALLAVSSPVIIDGLSLQISASIGVTLYPMDNENGDMLLRHADQAMYSAKQDGKNCYHLFDSKQDKKQQDHLAQIQRLTSALSDGQFVLFYQPKINMVSGEFIGLEALIRWQHPEHGLLPPSEFLDKITEHPLEIDLGLWVITTALNQMLAWGKSGLTVAVSVNISAHHLLHPKFVEQLAILLSSYPEILPEQLELEVLETVAMKDLNSAINVMNQCKALGVHLSLDDFGTGYSSLAYFRRLPVDTLKIDKSFVQDMTIDGEGLALVESVVRLAELFGRSSIAEGVETAEQFKSLVKLGCIQAQGYYFAKPMPESELFSWLENWHLRSEWQQNSIKGINKF